MEAEIRLIQYGTQEHSDFVALRYEILRKPLGLLFSQEALEEEVNDFLIGAFVEGALVGTLILTPKEGKEIKMRQVAVKETMQGSGIGKQLVEYAENYAAEAGYKKIVLHARKNAVPFYEALNYKSVGDEFEEVGIPHFAMEKTL